MVRKRNKEGRDREDGGDGRSLGDGSGGRKEERGGWVEKFYGQSFLLG